MKPTPAELWDTLMFSNPDDREKQLQLLIDAAETVKTLAPAKRRTGRQPE